jgi:hypothetical protein
VGFAPERELVHAAIAAERDDNLRPEEVVGAYVVTQQAIIVHPAPIPPVSTWG